MGYFPFFMDIEGKNGVVVGGGKVAARKIEKLTMFHPLLTVIAPVIEPCVKMQREALLKEETATLQLLERPFEMEDLSGADFVIAATDDEALNGCIAAYCKAQRIPVNVVDDREKCTFLFPALIKDGPLTIGISTDGKSPLAASWVRREIAGKMPEGIGDTIDLLGQIRPVMLQMEMEESARKELFVQMFHYCMEKGKGVSVEELMGFLKTGSGNEMSS